jgi:preprotein translocase subunit SecD
MSFFSKLGEGLSSTLGFIWWPFVGLYKLLFRNMGPRKKVWYSFSAILLLAVLAFLVDWPGVPSWVPGSAWFTKHNIELGLDLRGGSHLVYQADMSHVPPADQGDAIQGVRDIIDRRVNPQGLSETLVQTDKVGDNYRVIVELPGVTDVQQAIKLIGETPILEFKEQSTVVPDTTAVDKFNAEAKKKAEGLLARAKRGENFANLAKQYSEDEGSKAQGGDLGYFAKGVMVKPFEDAVWSLKVGQISPQLVQTDFGYHIIKKTGERQGTNGPEMQASHILIKTQAKPTPDTWATTQLSGKQLTRASVEFDQQTGLPQVNLTFNDEGKKLFSELTARNVGKPIAIFLDGSAISVPTVQQAITGGSATISGNFSLPEAKQLAQRLNSGALPVPVKLLTQEKVDATLGRASVEKSLLAGLLGIVLVAFFMIAYYRLPGLLAVLALTLYSGLTLAIFKLVPITLSLAGIAGYILSIGMAVDANVLIFERLREELRAGKPLTQAIEEGFKRAWTSIRDSNVSSLITAFVLMWFGTSLVKGFAITLILGILVSMFSAITVTRTLLRLVAVGRVTNWRFPFGVARAKAVTPTNPS